MAKERSTQMNTCATSKATTFLAAVIVIATVVQAFTVLLINTPRNPFRSALSPVLFDYQGPVISQNWSLFAPTVDTGNAHVILRARLKSGRLTGWYDATKFFLVEMRQNRFTPTRALSEVLAHSIEWGIAGKTHQMERDSMIRVATMVLQQYVPARNIQDVQVEVDRWSMARPGSPRKRDVNFVKQLPWAAVPDVAKI